MTQAEAHEYNIDAAYREMDARETQGEDMSHYKVCHETYAIVRVR